MTTNYAMIKDGQGFKIGNQSAILKAAKAAKRALKCKVENLGMLRFGEPNTNEHIYWYDTSKSNADYWITSLKRDDLLWNWTGEKFVGKI